MELLTPHLGTAFWLTVVFLIVYFILKKYAWGPILEALEARERRIEEALQAAEAAKEELRRLKREQARLVEEAKRKEAEILREAERIKELMLEEAREEARKAAEKILEEARREAELLREKALVEVKLQAVDIVLQLAEKVLRRELKDRKAHEEYIQTLIKEMDFHVAGRN